MDRKIILYVLGTAVLGFIGIMMMMPEDRDDGEIRLPWLVSADSQDRTRVLGFTIGETTLADIRKTLEEEGKINLFSNAEREDRFSVEAYFDQIYLNGLRADLVFSIDATQTELEAMYMRGLRISQLGGGGKKVKLTPADIALLERNPIRAITYLPWKSLDAEILEKRFGKPERILTEEEGVAHWLYPTKGMDIGLDTDGGVVIQYVNPGDLEKLLLPLQGGSESTEPPTKPEAIPAPS